MPNALRALALSSTIALAACSSGGLGVSKDSPFAPPPDINAQGEDPLIVGHRLLNVGENELALKAFKRAAADRGLTTEIISAMGTANLGLGRLNQAETLMRRATDEQDASAEDWNNLGVVLMERGKTAEAVQIFRTAYAMDNGQSDSIRDNLRLALAKLENVAYDPKIKQDYKVVRRGNGEFLLRKRP